MGRERNGVWSGYLYLVVLVMGWRREEMLNVLVEGGVSEGVKLV